MPGTPYLSLSELRAEPWNISTDEAPDARLQALQAQVKDTLDAACEQRFDNHQRVITGYGNNSSLFQPTLYDVPPFGRMRTLVSVTVDGVVEAITQFRVMPWQLEWLPATVGALPEIFPQSRPVVLTVDCGFAAIPDDVKRLYGLLILRALRPELREGEKFDSESLAGRSYTARRLGGKEVFGDPEIDRLVEDWRYHRELNWAAV